MLFSWLDGLIWKSYRAGKLEIEELPPLADVDHAEALFERAASVSSTSAWHSLTILTKVN